MVLLVSFQLSKENPAFEGALKSMGNWSNRIQGGWVLETRLSPRQVRDLLGQHMAPEDRLFVARITQNWAGRGMGPGFPEWMNRRTTFNDTP